MTYLKGKDIKQQGDCLVYCFIKNIETIISGQAVHADGYKYSECPAFIHFENIKRWHGDPVPEGFEKW